MYCTYSRKPEISDLIPRPHPSISQPAAKQLTSNIRGIKRRKVKAPSPDTPIETEREGLCLLL